MPHHYSTYDVSDFARDTNVSRETLEAYKKWERLLTHWNKSINLVQKGTVEEFWERHALDSQQLCSFIPQGALRCLDLGSGAGFPGLALAIHLKGIAGAQVDLVESNGKKCSFLRAVIRELELPAKVLQERVEELPAKGYDMISARAFAPLLRLLDYASPFWQAETLGVFPKGRNYKQEHALAQQEFKYDLELSGSRSDGEAKILLIKNLSLVSGTDLNIKKSG